MRRPGGTAMRRRVILGAILLVVVGGFLFFLPQIGALVAALTEPAEVKQAEVDSEHDHEEEEDPAEAAAVAAAPDALFPDELATAVPFALEPANPGPAKTERVLRFAVIGDFGLDGYKPKTAAAEAKKKADAEAAKSKAVGTSAGASSASAPTAVLPSTSAAASASAQTAATSAPAPTTAALPAPTAAAAMETPTPGEPLQNPRQAAVARKVADWAPDFVVTTGDNNYPRGEATTIDRNIGKYYASFIGNYQGAFGKGAESNRFFPVLGNHDWDMPNKQGCRAYLDYFTLPGNERYYDFVQGPVHFFMLDTDAREPDGIKVGSKQHAWFVKAAAASRAPFQVVVSHHPPYSSGEHGDNKPCQWAFHKHGVDMVVSGHDHDYERIERDGLVHIVNGSAGANLRKFRKKPVEGSLVRYRRKHGAMRFDVVAAGADLQLLGRFVTLDGEEVDAFSIVRPKVD